MSERCGPFSAHTTRGVCHAVSPATKLNRVFNFKHQNTCECPPRGEQAVLSAIVGLVSLDGPRKYCLFRCPDCKRFRVTLVDSRGGELSRGETIETRVVVEMGARLRT